MLKNLLFALVLAVLCTGAATAQVSEQEMQMGAPDARHERLKIFEGEWTTTATYYFAPGKPMTGTGTASNKMILGGRFLEMKGSNDMAGMKFEMLTILGFDKGTEKYTLVGFDELGTYYVEGEGSYDEASKTFTLPGTYIEPISKKKMDYKFVYDVSNPDTLKFAVVFMNMPDMPAEFTMVEGTYNRNK